MVDIVGEDESAKKKKTCHNCASVLVFTLDEVQRGRETDYTGCTETYSYIVCPKCQAEVHPW